MHDILMLQDTIQVGEGICISFFTEKKLLNLIYSSYILSQSHIHYN